MVEMEMRVVLHMEAAEVAEQVLLVELLRVQLQAQVEQEITGQILYLVQLHQVMELQDQFQELDILQVEEVEVVMLELELEDQVEEEMELLNLELHKLEQLILVVEEVELVLVVLVELQVLVEVV
jgi:hypothetical protein